MKPPIVDPVLRCGCQGVRYSPNGIDMIHECSEHEQAVMIDPYGDKRTLYYSAAHWCKIHHHESMLR